MPRDCDTSSSRQPPINRVEPVITRQECAATVLGGPTTVLDVGGLRIVSDPTFDDPGPHGYLTKTAGPAVAEDQLGPVDLVLVRVWEPIPLLTLTTAGASERR